MAGDAAIVVNGEPTQLSSMHWLPFGIGMDGPAPSSAEFFQPLPQQQQQQQQQQQAQHQQAAAASTAAVATAAAAGAQQQTYTASFRGRQLRGALRALPEGYRGLLLRPLGGASADTEQRSWAAAGSFGALTLWNHDTPPASSDWHNRCLDWLVLADKVHAPIDAASVERELLEMRAQ